MYEDRLKTFTRLYDDLSNIYGNVNVFMDFVKMCAISIYNQFAKNQEMEQEYLGTINTYEKEHQNIFPRMFVELIMMYEDAKDIIDILGPFYEREHLGNSHLGQFFTPSHISELMAEITLEDEEKLKNRIEKNGFITMTEPTCGAGGMILSLAKVLQKRNINYQQNLLVIANDISDVCVYMTYIQLALYGIPAIVCCGNALTQETRFTMETPLYYIQDWKFREFYMSSKEELKETEQKIIIEKTIENQINYKETIIKGNCQISLW